MLISAALALCLAVWGCSSSDPRRRTHEKGLIVLGIDGMDPVFLRRCIREGLTPNLARLAEKGTFVSLQTSTPPQSPVAWSNFITSMTPSGHGIYDFIHRDLDGMKPYLSTSRTRPPAHTIRIGSYVIPLSSGTVSLLRRGRPFWEYLEDDSIPATIIKIPSNFPPESSSPAEVVSGMGTPDLVGTYGTFHFLTTDASWLEKEVAGGRVAKLDFGSGQHARASITGPKNPVDAEGTKLTAPIEIVKDRKRPVALIRLGDKEHILCPGEWSKWIPISFDPGLVASDIRGMVRVYLKSLEPHVSLYVSPINIDPLEPAMPVSSPESFSASIAEEVGRYYTQGMAEDTKALEASVLTDEEFLAQADVVLQERIRMLRRELGRFRGGLLFFYFSSVDQMSHMFWRTLEPGRKGSEGPSSEILYKLYARMDKIVGEVLEAKGENTELMIMSDHGFAPCRRNFQLNTWLARQGYLVVADSSKRNEGFLGHIDWSKTQAYGLGLNQIFVNLEGREPHGVVPLREREGLVRRIGRQLEAFRDPDTGKQVVTRTFIQPYGMNEDRSPDLIVGYNRGYRCATDSAMGRVSQRVVEPNTDKWSGDHCMDPALVPGVFLSTMEVDAARPSLLDLGPTVLDYFGIEPPDHMVGESLFVKEEKPATTKARP
jgi:predicted AlkP superfamily phosphohydrolase/phosphomutase